MLVTLLNGTAVCTNVPSKEFSKSEVEGVTSESENEPDRELGVDVIGFGFCYTGVEKAGL